MAAPAFAACVACQAFAAPAQAEPASSEPRYADAEVQATPLATRAGPALSIKPASGTPSTASLGDVIRRVRAIHRDRGRLVVLGEIGPAGATEVRIVDWATGQAVDSFWAYDPAVSPDGALVAFVRFYPVHFVDGTESQYRLYRVQAGPEANRSFYKGQAEQGAFSHGDVGQPLYPAGSGKPPRGNIGLTDEQAHEHLSRLAWSSDSRQVAFLDAQRGKAKVVVVPVPEGGARARPLVLPPLDGLGKLCLRGADPNDCTVLPQEAVALGFEPGGKGVKVQLTQRSLYPSGYAKVVPIAAPKPGK